MEFTCKEAVPMIGAYLDGELSPASAALLRPHLLGCPACRNSSANDRTPSVSPWTWWYSRTSVILDPPDY